MRMSTHTTATKDGERDSRGVPPEAELRHACRVPVEACWFR